MGLKQRLPEWYKEDGIVETLHKENEKVKLKSYQNLLRRYVEQPTKIWALYEKESISHTEDLIKEDRSTYFDVEVTKSYPVMPEIVLKDETSCTPPNAIEGPIIIEYNGKELEIDASLPASGELVLTPDNLLINGKDRRYSTKLAQMEAVNAIPFGKSSFNKQLKQVFIPTHNTNIVEIMMGTPNGIPFANVICEFREVEKGTENYLENFVIENRSFEVYNYKPFKTKIKLENTLVAGRRYVLLLKVSEIYSNDNYFTVMGSATHDFPNGELYAFNYSDTEGNSWERLDYDIYIRTIVPTVTGDYPTIDSSESRLTISHNGLVPEEDCIPCYCPEEDQEVLENPQGTINVTCNYNLVTMDSVHAKVMAYRQYPLKSVSLYKDDGTLLQERKWLKEKKQVCYHMIIDAEDIEYDDLPQKFYAKAEWHYFEAEKKFGFPQSYEEDDLKYKPNKALDVHAAGYGMFRRAYREDIPYYEYDRTFPVGYPFEIEQDYWLEKRLLEEYTERAEVGPDAPPREIGVNDAMFLEDDLDYEELIPKDEIEPSNAIYDDNYSINKLYLKDTEGNKVLRLEANKPGLHNITITTFNDGFSDIIRLEEITKENQYIVEEYKLTNYVPIGMNYTVADSPTIITNYDVDGGQANPVRLEGIAEYYNVHPARTYVVADSPTILTNYSIDGGMSTSVPSPRQFGFTRTRPNYLAADAPYIITNTGYEEGTVCEWAAHYEVEEYQTVYALADSPTIYSGASTDRGMRADWETEEKEYPNYSDNFRKLANKITEESQLVKAVYLDYPRHAIHYEVQYLLAEGTYNRLGLIKSETYAHLGVVPAIRNMWQYIVFWNKNYWDSHFVYAGDEYVPGAFRVDVPWPIPTNFKVMNNPDLNLILDRCKKFGTYVDSAYSWKTRPMYLSALFKASTTPPLAIYEQEFRANLYTYNAVEEDFAFTIDSGVDFMEISQSFNLEAYLSTDVSVYSIVHELDAHTLEDFEKFALTEVETVRVGDKAVIQLKDATKNSESYAAWCQNWQRTGGRHVYDCYVHGPTDELYWTNLGAIGVNVPGAVATETPGWGYQRRETKLLVAGGFSFDIPDNAKILGVQVDFQIQTGQDYYQKYRGSYCSGCWWSSGCSVSEPGGPMMNMALTTSGNIFGASYWTLDYSDPYKRRIIAPGNEGWHTETFGGIGEFWGMGINKWMLNDLRVLLFVGRGMYNPQYHVNRDIPFQIDWIRIKVYFKRPAGVFQTNTVKAVPDGTAALARWSKFEHQLLEPIPGDCTLEYNIVKEKIIAQQPDADDYIEFGITEREKILAIVKTNNTNVSGIKVESAGYGGAPPEGVRVSLCRITNLIPQSIIGTHIIREWEEGEKEFNYDIGSLDPNGSYGLLVERLGTPVTFNRIFLRDQKNTEFLSLVMKGTGDITITTYEEGGTEKIKLERDNTEEIYSFVNANTLAVQINNNSVLAKATPLNSPRTLLKYETQILKTSNYLKLRVKKNASGQYVKFLKSNNWDGVISGMAMKYKIYNIFTIVKNPKPPFNMQNVEYSDIKIRGNMTSNSLYTTPKVCGLDVWREAYYNFDTRMDIDNIPSVDCSVNAPEIHTSYTVEPESAELNEPTLEHEIEGHVLVSVRYSRIKAQGNVPTVVIS
jgi:hypothetical protein